MKDVLKIILAIVVIVIVWKIVKGLIGLLVGLVIAGLIVYGGVKLAEGIGQKRIHRWAIPDRSRTRTASSPTSMASRSLG